MEIEAPLETHHTGLGNFTLKQDHGFDSSYKLEERNIVKMEKNYEELYQSLLNNVENLNPLICLLYGYTGNGRKTCIRWCIDKVQDEFTTDEILLEKFFINATI
jgi:Cdc6-like AAA superfamily ATPase